MAGIKKHHKKRNAVHGVLKREVFMKNTFFKIWIHIVWSTKDREPLLINRIRKNVFFHIKEIASEKDYHLDMINGTNNHLHCLLSLDPKYAVSKVVNDLKGESSHWINSQNLLKAKFAWQRGFGAFSVSESNVKKVRKYILNQEKHHKMTSFKDEWELLLKKHGVVYETA